MARTLRQETSQIRAQITRPGQTLDLTPAECWQLLAGVSLGRIVFTQHPLPAIGPVNHLVDDQTIIIGSHLGPAIVAHATADNRSGRLPRGRRAGPGPAHRSTA